MSRALIAFLVALFLGPCACSLSARVCVRSYTIDTDNLAEEFAGTIREMGFPIWYREYAEPVPGERSEPVFHPNRWLANEALWFTGIFALTLVLVRRKGQSAPAPA